MSEETAPKLVIPVRFSHGTATPIYHPAVVPKDKRECELFWTKVLISRLDDLKSQGAIANICDDDSNGNHDVIIHVPNQNSIGVQVTELTYGIGRAGKDQRDKFVDKVFKCFKEQQLSSSRMLKVQCSMPPFEGKKFTPPEPEQIAAETSKFIRSSKEQDIATINGASLFFQWVDEGMIYGRSEAGIGFDCNLDLIPRTPDQFRNAIDQIRDKKKDAKSPWLLIWSRSYWQAGRDFEESVLQHLRASFANSHFEKVYFIESMDMLPYFEINLHCHTIKQ